MSILGAGMGALPLLVTIAIFEVETKEAGALFADDCPLPGPGADRDAAPVEEEYC